MSQGFFPNGISTALDAIAELALKVALLKSWPPANATSSAQLNSVTPELFGLDAHPLLGLMESAVVDGVTCVRNAYPITFGAISESQTVVGWALLTGATPIAWGPLVDADGLESAFTLNTNDEVQIPAGALKVGLV